MPRKSQSSLAIVPFPSTPKPPSPREKASTTVKAILREIVDSAPPKQFAQSDAPLIEALAQAIANSHVAQAQIEKYGLVHGLKPSPWTLTLEKSHKVIIALSLRLRLSPQSRMDRKSTKLQGPPANDPARPWLTEDDENEP